MNCIRVNQMVIRALDGLSRIKKTNVRERIAEMEAVIERCAQNMRNEGAGDKEVNDRLFAICAFCDEVHIAPLFSGGPSRYSLMQKRFGTKRAAVDFYCQAEELAKRKDQAYMIYWLVFRCGFRGCLYGSVYESDNWEITARHKVMEIAQLVLKSAYVPSRRMRDSGWCSETSPV